MCRSKSLVLVVASISAFALFLRVPGANADLVNPSFELPDLPSGTYQLIGPTGRTPTLFTGHFCVIDSSGAPDGTQWIEVEHGHGFWQNTSIVLQNGANYRFALCAKGDRVGGGTNDSLQSLAADDSSTMGNSFRSEKNLFLANSGQPQATIAIGPQAAAFDRWVATELQRYLKKLTGAALPVVTTDQLPAQTPLVIVGGPQVNPLSAAAQQQKLLDFTGLKPDGFLLKTINLAGRPAVVVGGNDEASTMYAAYAFLEQLGIVFQLTNDIIPQQRPDLPLPALDARVEPVMKYRYLLCCHGLRWYMGLEEFRKHIDQMAKLKLNCLQFYWGMGGPWTKFSYGGKVQQLLHSPESGYTAWSWGDFSTSGTAKDVRVGRECFPKEFLGPPEFANVRTPEAAYRTARDFLQEIIRYAHQRKVQVWLMLGEIPFVPPNLVPPASKQWMNMYCGTGIPCGDPVLLDIWEAAIRSIIETYPEADSYGVCLPEHHPPAGDPQTQQLMKEYAATRKLIPSVEEIHQQGSRHVRDAAGVEGDFATVCVADKLVRRIKASHPTAKFGYVLLWRGYLFRALDSLLPKDVWIQNMEDYANTRPLMHFYGQVSGRDMLTFPVIDDDGCELHMQINAKMYDEDEIISGGARYGVAGVGGALLKERGLEFSTRYLAEGAWNRAIESQSFYENYLRRLYGPDAMTPLLTAYLILQDSDKALGWRAGLRHIFVGYRRFTPCSLRKDIDYKADRPKLDRQLLERDVNTAWNSRKFWAARIAQCRQALELLRQAQPKVPPGSRAELEYVIFKTESLISYFKVLDAWEEARAALDEALLAKNSGDTAAVSKQLDQCRTALDRTDRLAREVARQMTAYVDIPTERYLLFRYNQSVLGSLESDEEYLTQVLAFHKSLAR